MHPQPSGLTVEFGDHCDLLRSQQPHAPVFHSSSSKGNRLNKYIAQPQYNSNSIAIYDITNYDPTSDPPVPATLTATLQGGEPLLSGPNCVLVYQDFSAIQVLSGQGVPVDFPKSTPQQCLLVACQSTDDNGKVTGGNVNVYDLESLNLLTEKPTLPNPTTVLPLGTGYTVIGMAIQPGTGDLYVASPSTSSDNPIPVITIFAKALGGAWSTAGNTGVFDYNSLGGFSTTPSNLAFDSRGFLWMTSFGHDNNGVAYNYLTCFPGVANATPQSTPNFWFANDPVTQLKVTPLIKGTAPTLLFGLSSPEGIAFDPAGNLWVASNNEEYVGSDVNTKFSNAGGGSLLMISAEYLLGLLFPTAHAPNAQINLNEIPAGGVTVYYINDQSQPGGLFFDGFTLYINDENNYDGAGNPVVWQMTVNSDGSPATALTQAGGIVETTNRGNGTMAVFNYPPFSSAAFTTPSLAQLAIADWSGDFGVEPDTLAGAPAGYWESNSLGLDIAGLAGLGTDAAQSVPFDPAASPFGALNGDVDYSSLTNDTAYVFAQVQNLDSVPSVGNEVLKLYWAHATTSPLWPNPWTNLISDSATATQTLGGFIGAFPLGSIPAGQACVVQLPWVNVPEPLKFVDAPPGSDEQAHFCLMSRIEGNGLYPFGMTSPEEWSFNTGDDTQYVNVTNNRGVAQRNIKITEAGATGDLRKQIFPILGGNYGAVERSTWFGLETVNYEGVPAKIPAEVTVVASGKSLERFLEAEHESKLQKILCEIVHVIEELLGFEHLGEGRFRWNDLEKGMHKLRLRPGDQLPFIVEFTPEEGVKDYAVRITQYQERDGKAVATGGQTFVCGNVKGYPVRTRRLG